MRTARSCAPCAEAVQRHVRAEQHGPMRCAWWKASAKGCRRSEQSRVSSGRRKLVQQVDARSGLECGGSCSRWRLEREQGHQCGLEQCAVHGPSMLGGERLQLYGWLLVVAAEVVRREGLFLRGATKEEGAEIGCLCASVWCWIFL